MSGLEDELAELEASHAKRLRDGRDGGDDDDNDDGPPKKRPSSQETKMLVLEVVIQDDESTTSKFYVPMAHVPEFLKILMIIWSAMLRCRWRPRNGPFASSPWVRPLRSSLSSWRSVTLSPR